MALNLRLAIAFPPGFDPQARSRPIPLRCPQSIDRHGDTTLRCDSLPPAAPGSKLRIIGAKEQAAKVRLVMNLVAATLH
jgi:hypothetical protein